MNGKPVCGFIGLGSQGAPIAQRMMDGGYPMVLWARRAETLNPFSGTNAEFADSIHDLGKIADHVGICVVGDKGVTDICEQLIQSMRPGGRIAVHSTVLPNTCKVLAKKALDREISLIDAPVSGGKPAAAVGQLTLMLGGDSPTIEQARPVFETFSNLMILLGDVGAGQEAKLINNSLMAANMGLAHNAINAGLELGLDHEALLQLLSASSGRSFALDVYARQKNSGNIEFARTLLEKVELLGDVLGDDHPAYLSIKDAAWALKN